jgi:hypothetical protein
MTYREFLRVERRLIRGCTRAWAEASSQRHRSEGAARPVRVPPARVQPGPAARDPRVPTLTDRILEAAAKLAGPDEVMPVAELAGQIGARVQDVHARISHLRAEGRWPYRSAWEGANARAQPQAQ